MPTLDEILDDLKTTVKKLESPNSLEQSLELYQHGVKLVAEGSRLLRDAETKITVLSQDGKEIGMP